MDVLLHYLLLNRAEILQDQEVSKNIFQLKNVCMIDFEEIITRNREKDKAYIIINIQDCIKCCLHDKSNSINKIQVLISIEKCFLPKAFII